MPKLPFESCVFVNCPFDEEGEYFRLNMHFELGIDYGCRQYFGKNRGEKRSLVPEEEKYRYQAVISDLSGFDIQYHEGDFEKAVRKVRNWLVSEAGVKAVGPRKIPDSYSYFQEWHYKRQLAAGFSDEDIKDYSTEELLKAMKQWVAEGQPV